MTKIIFRTLLLTVILVMVSGVGRAQDSTLVIDDFENGVPFGLDQYHNGLGFVPWGNVFGNVTLSARQVIPESDLSLLGHEADPDTVLAVAYDIAAGGWGGFTHALTDGKSWISQDWTAYNAIQFWIYGNGTGGTVQLDLFDNRNPNLTGDSSERYYYRITDDFTGWQQFTIPFDLFKRRTDFQPSGAPDDGLGLNEVTGYAFGFPANVGAQTAYIDQVELVNVEDTAAIGVVGATATPSQEAGTTVENITWDSRQWELLWGDEFDGPAGAAINPDNWNCEVGGSGWGNNEREYYTPGTANVSLDGEGSMVITARQENPDNQECWYGKCTHTSARCTTEGKVEFTYGRVEARIRVPYGQGIWPAFWMLGANFKDVGWPGSGEIDIMENIGKEPKTVHGTVHGPSYSGGSGIGKAYDSPNNFADDYHVYAVDWDTDAIRWYVDGNLYFTFTPADLGKRRWVFDHDFFILLNVAVGGQWPGDPDKTTVFPQTMKVDYVRVYQLKKGQ
jgi:beta-glucanase (GH16 family)